ncbi:MAG: hypothetical protein OCD00_03070 [Colwellia sp.]
MLGALTSLTGGGGLSASGGEATSGNGDQAQNNSTTFGGLNYGGTGVSPLLVGFIVVAVVGAVVYLKK